MGRTRTRTATGIVLDAGALIALDRGDKRMIALLDRALAQGRVFRVPAGVVGQAWRDGRVQVTLEKFQGKCGAKTAPSRSRLRKFLSRECQRAVYGNPETALARFLRAEEVEIVPLDRHLARACGELCAATNSKDVIDASVAILARERRDPIVTSDPKDLRRLDPAARIIAV